jgi:hypothetical protein
LPDGVVKWAYQFLPEETTSPGIRDDAVPESAVQCKLERSDEGPPIDHNRGKAIGWPATKATQKTNVGQGHASKSMASAGIIERASLGQRADLGTTMGNI